MDPDVLLGSRTHDANINTWQTGCAMTGMSTVWALFPVATDSDQIMRIPYYGHLVRAL